MRRRIAERWGEDLVQSGEVDRTRVAEVVFEQPEELRWLESQLHPLVGERVAAWVAALEPGAIGVVEIPLLFETAMEPMFDAVVCVVTEDGLRRERAAARGQQDLEARERRQLSQEEKAARADHVISNDAGLAELESEIAGLLPRLTHSD